MKVVIYTTKTFPTCLYLEEMMKNKGIEFEIKLLEEPDNMVEMLFIGSQPPNHQRWSSPILCIDGKFVESGKEIEWIEGYNHGV